MRAATSREPAKLRFPQKHQIGVTASLFHSVQYILLPTHPPLNPRPLKLIYLQCIRTPGPCAPAHQMVVQPMLCPCHEGSDVQGTSQTQVSPETPVWRHCLSLPQCAVYFTSHPPTPEPAPSQTDLPTVHPHTTRTPGPCAPAHQMVVQPMLCPCHEGSDVQGTSQTQVSPETPVWRHCLSLPQCAVYFTSHPPTHKPAPSQTDLPTVHPHTGAVRSRPSDGCSTYAVPVS